MVIDELELVALRASVANVTLGAAEALIARGTKALAQNDLKTAADLTQAALVLSPCDYEALRLAGDIASARDDQALAQRAYERAILENPSDWRSARALAAIHASQGRPDRAHAMIAMLAADDSVPPEGLVAL